VGELVIDQPEPGDRRWDKPAAVSLLHDQDGGLRRGRLVERKKFNLGIVVSEDEEIGSHGDSPVRALESPDYFSCVAIR